MIRIKRKRGQMLALAVLTFGLAGCAFNRTAVVTDRFDLATGKLQEREKRTFTSSMWAQATALKGLAAHKHTEKTGADLSIAEASNETQTELISALVEGAVKGAVKGAK
jgi:hypothetical protein